MCVHILCVCVGGGPFHIWSTCFEDLLYDLEVHSSHLRDLSIHAQRHCGKGGFATDFENLENEDEDSVCSTSQVSLWAWAFSITLSLSLTYSHSLTHWQSKGPHLQPPTGIVTRVYYSKGLEAIVSEMSRPSSLKTAGPTRKSKHHPHAVQPVVLIGGGGGKRA